MAKLVLLFTVVPLAELYLLLQIGGALGPWPTVGIVLVTGLVGAWLARREGLRVLRQWQGSLAAGKVPEEGVLGGVLVLVGGVLLVTPGVVTDAVGLLLLIPPSRRLIAEQVRRRVEARVADGRVKVVRFSPGEGDMGPFGVGGEPSRRSVIDVEPDSVRDGDA